MDSILRRLILWVLMVTAVAGYSQAQETFNYQAPALGSSDKTKRNDLNLELQGIDANKVDFSDIDTSAEIRAIVGDEVGTGALMFGLAPSMSNDLSCTGSQIVRRNSGNTLFECFTPTFLTSADIDTSAELRAILTDETGTGAAYFVGGALGTPASGTLTNATGLPISTGVSGLGTNVATFLTTPSMANLGSALSDDASGWTTFGTTPSSANLRSLLTDELGTGVLFFLGAPAGDDQIFVSTSTSAGAWGTIPTTSATQKLSYDQTTNTFSAATDDDVPEAGDFTNLSATAPITQSGGTISTSIATSRIVGRTTAGTGVMEELTGATATTLLSNLVGDSGSGGTKGLAPAPAAGDAAAGKFLKADGTWAAPPGAAGGDSVSVNGTAATDADLDDTTPAAASGGVNVKWQKDALTPNNISAYVPNILGKRTIAIPAGALKPRATNGCTTGTFSGTNVEAATCDFIDGATAKLAQFQVPQMPKSTDESAGLEASFTWTTSTASNAVVWGIKCVAISDDDVLDTAMGTEQEVTDTVTAANDEMITSYTSTIIPGNSWTEGDSLYCEVRRDSNNGSDTNTGTARLLGITLRYTINALRDD